MIKIDRTYTITLLDSNVINYSITSNKPSCITINNASGSFNGTTIKIYVTYHVANLDCFKDNTITIIVTNDKGCSSTFTDTLVNECNSLDVNIEQPDANNLSFNAIVTGGKPPYLFNWIYDLESQFSSNEPNTGFHSQNQLSLTWNHNPANILPPGYKNPQAVKVEVKDANGCISNAVNYYTLTCEPFVASQSIVAPCFPITTGDVRKFPITLTNSGCGNLVNNPLVISYTNATQRSLGNNRYEITIPEFSTTSVVLPITVTNDKNVPSNTFNVTVTKLGDCKIKPDCAAGFILNTYTNNSKTVTFDNSAFALTEGVDFATDYIDYNTFTFIADVSAGQVLTNPTTLTITNKGVAKFDYTIPTTPLITYKPSSPSTGIIPIKWQIKNDCGDLSQEFTLNINSVLSTAPVVTNITKTLFFGETLSTIVTDTNNVTVTKFEITTFPSVGNISISNTGVINYNPISYSATNQVLTLKPVNQYGKVGNSFTITYTILSSGIARPLETCTPLVNFSLFSLLQNGSYSQGVWSGNGITNNTVSLNTPGSYTYVYTVTNPIDNTTRATSVVISYISLSISDLDIIYVDSSTRKAKITTLGFTTEQLNTITRINVRIITNNISYLISNVAVESKVDSILYANFSLIDENSNNIIRNDYTSIEVIIPEELNNCNSNITRIYNKPFKELQSISNTGVGTVTNVELLITPVPSLGLQPLTASGILANTKMFDCDGTFTYTYDALLNKYFGYKSTNAIVPSNPYPVENGSAVEYSVFGTKIYPVSISGSNIIYGWNDKGDEVTPNTATVLSTSYWRNIAENTTDGPGNRHGIWANDGQAGDGPLNKWIGFSKCIDNITVGKIYYVGIFADNQFKLILNSTTILNTDQDGSLDGTTLTFKYWHVYPVYIPAGKNTLELTALNAGDKGGLGCVIYDNTLAELTAATSNNDLNIIFNSKLITSIDIVRSSSGLLETPGYTCPSGYNTYSPCNNGECLQNITCS
jgi:hypothetical protein